MANPIISVGVTLLCVIVALICYPYTLSTLLLLQPVAIVIVSLATRTGPNEPDGRSATIRRILTVVVLATLLSVFLATHRFDVEPVLQRFSWVPLLFPSSARESLELAKDVAGSDDKALWAIAIYIGYLLGPALFLLAPRKQIWLILNWGDLKEEAKASGCKRLLYSILLLITVLLFCTYNQHVNIVEPQYVRDESNLWFSADRDNPISIALYCYSMSGLFGVNGFFFIHVVRLLTGSYESKRTLEAMDRLRARRQA